MKSIITLLLTFAVVFLFSYLFGSMIFSSFSIFEWNLFSGALKTFITSIVLIFLFNISFNLFISIH